MPDPETAPASHIRILIVDDHLIVRLGLTSLLKMEPDFRVVSEAEDGEAALRLFRSSRPDIVLLDSRMPGGDGLDVLRRMKTEFPDVRAIIIGSSLMEEHVIRALNVGAVGYLTKAVKRAELAAAIRRVQKGGVYLAPAMEATLAKIDHRSRISPRELEVLELMRRGLSNRDVAKVLGVSEHTVKSHVKALLVKLDAADRAEAVATGFMKGLLLLDD
jgi:DNA-binding NarL/FixJ family response regulator